MMFSVHSELTPLTGLTPARAGEEIPAESLSRYLGVNQLAISQFTAGHSNLTYQIQTEQGEFVLRRGPLGPVAPKAHDMAREFRVLTLLHPVFPQAPRPGRLCEDPAVLGATFYLMERKHGAHYADPSALPPDAAASMSRAIVDTLAALHAVDIHATGLIAIGKPDGFLTRQVSGWADRWRRARLDESVGEDLIHWLESRIPAQLAPTVVHNDYKLDNLLFQGDRVEAVLDWEMATVGDPLADLGLMLCYWEDQGPPAPAGWLDANGVVERYGQLTGRDLASLPWHRVLGLFKLAVILQQIYFRFHQGQTADARFAGFGARALTLLHRAEEAAGRA
jgi:aminoglycoside phosphotransferase (APT) family kinase protein